MLCYLLGRGEVFQQYRGQKSSWVLEVYAKGASKTRKRNLWHNLDFQLSIKLALEQFLYHWQQVLNVLPIYAQNLCNELQLRSAYCTLHHMILFLPTNYYDYKNEIIFLTCWTVVFTIDTMIDSLNRKSRMPVFYWLKMRPFSTSRKHGNSKPKIYFLNRHLRYQ